MGGSRADESGVEWGIVVAKDVMVPMRDGVSLATDIYRPARDGKPMEGGLPTILGRTAYGKETDWLWVKQVGEYFARRGYAVAIQDIRGRGRSGGVGNYRHTNNALEGPDGHDTVEWIAAQEWSNQRIGTVGSSHGAIVQQLMALEQPPHLAAIWPDAGPTMNYSGHIREGGAMNLMMFGALFLHAHDAPELQDDKVAQRVIAEGMLNMRALVQQMPFKPGQTPLSVLPTFEETLFDYYWRSDYEDWWQQPWHNQRSHIDRHADIPGVYSGGWYDPFSRDTTTYFAEMTSRSSAPQRLIMGPWTHYGIFYGYGFAGDVELGPDAAWGFDRYNQERLRWFDRWLKDERNGVEDDPPVHLFVMGGGDGHKTAEGRLFHGGSWRTEREWPLARAQQRTLFLRASGRLSAEPPSQDDPPLGFTFDPAHPVPTVAGSVAGFFEVVPLQRDLEPFFADWFPLAMRMRNIVMNGGAHQKEEPEVVGAREPYPLLASRADVLVFETGPLGVDTEITGEITVCLWAASSALDTDFTAKLVDVYPPNDDYPAGYHLNIVDSIMRIRYRDSWESPTLNRPGEPFELSIPLPPTSNLFKAGHRIRLDISSSNFPRFDVNPNSGEPIGRHTRTEVAHQQVFVDRERPSRIVFPVVA